MVSLLICISENNIPAFLRKVLCDDLRDFVAAVEKEEEVKFKVPKYATELRDFIQTQVFTKFPHQLEKFLTKYDKRSIAKAKDKEKEEAEESIMKEIKKGSKEAKKSSFTTGKPPNDKFSGRYIPITLQVFTN